MKTYQISDLEVSLAVQMNSVKPTEDITGLRVDLEKYKKKIEELDSNNRDLSMQWSRLSVELRDKEATFNAKVDSYFLTNTKHVVCYCRCLPRRLKWPTWPSRKQKAKNISFQYRKNLASPILGIFCFATCANNKKDFQNL